MNKFKVGDIVRCIDGCGDHCTTGRVYTVTKAYAHNDGDAFIESRGSFNGMYERRFELVTPVTPATPVIEAKLNTETKTVTTPVSVTVTIPIEDARRFATNNHYAIVSVRNEITKALATS